MRRITTPGGVRISVSRARLRFTRMIEQIKVHLCCDLAESVSGANLVIEAAPECTALKQKLLLEVLERVRYFKQPPTSS